MTKLDRAERALWLRLAEAWDKPDTNINKHPSAQGSYGLCPLIEAFTDGGAVAIRMRAKVAERLAQKSIKSGGAIYGWPRTLAGAKSRAAFCRKQAAALAKPATPRAGGRGRR